MATNWTEREKLVYELALLDARISMLQALNECIPRALLSRAGRLRKKLDLYTTPRFGWCSL